ncbi:heat-inducible transcriptional repressor HrcA [Pontimonas sp.]|jgi:heat-inducible transcriptional repressor|nr:heat-inducible transcriptional repressor HrcA [Microbacteriaceae bacterium]MDA9786492.1 heat-inducible transcriptional repressor HrcA [Pontimonas sp.]
MVSDRALEVLRVIVQDYIDSKEPVASKAIADRHGFGVSAATIRNDMAILEEEELITAPHTSAGRIPTDKGYRVFVDQLAGVKPLTPAQRRAIEQFLSESADLDDTLTRTVRLLSQLTNQVAILQYPSLSVATVRHVELLPMGSHRVMTVLITDGGSVDQNIVECNQELDDAVVAELRAHLNQQLVGISLSQMPEKLAALSGTVSPQRASLVQALADALLHAVEGHRTDRLMMAGASNLVRGEHDFSSSVYPVLEAIEQQVTLLKLFTEMKWESQEVQARIGRENEGPFSETAVLASAYQSKSDQRATLGVVGPTRMDYSSNMTAVRAVASYLSTLLGDPESERA